MNKAEFLFKIVSQLSERQVEEVIDFASYLLQKEEGIVDYALLSQDVLAEDWLSPEDEEAFKDL